MWEGSATTAAAGYAVYAISVPWVAYQSTHSLLVVGLVLFAEVGIYTLTFLIGPLVDRARDKRTIYLACYPAQAVAAATLGLEIELRTLTVPILLGLIVVLSILWDFAWAANNVAPRLLLSQDDLFRAAGLGGTLGGAAQVAGYAGGAVLLVVVSSAGGLYLYAALLVVASAFASRVPLRASGVQAPGRYLAEFRAGWDSFRSGRAGGLRPLAVVESVRGFFSTAPTLLIVLLIAGAYSSDGSAYAALYVAWVIGGVLVGLALGRMNPRRSVGRVLLLGALGLAGLYAVVGLLARPLPAEAVAWFALGAALAAFQTTESVYLQGNWPAETLGRITSNLYVFTGAAGAVGAVVLGALALSWSPAETGALAAAGYAVVAVGVLASPALRHLGF